MKITIEITPPNIHRGEDKFSVRVAVGSRDVMFMAYGKTVRGALRQAVERIIEWGNLQ